MRRTGIDEEKQMEDLKKLLKSPNIIGMPFGLQLRGSPFVDLSGQKRWNIPDKVIIKAAVTGALFSKAENPNHPCTPDEIRAAIAESIEAGASSVHIHLRDKSGLPTGDMKLYHETIDPIKEKYGDGVLIDGCALFGATFEEVMRPVTEGLFEVCPVNTTAVYIGDTLFAVPPQTMQAAAKIMRELNCKPQIAVYTSGDIDNAKRYLIDTGILAKPYYWIVVPSLPGCFPMPDPLAMAEGLSFLVRRIREIDAGSVIMVCAAGRASNYLSTLAILMGLHVRVGMEDTIYHHPHRDELLKSNRESVESAIRVASELGRAAATARDYREIVGIRHPPA